MKECSDFVSQCLSKLWVTLDSCADDVFDVSERQTNEIPVSRIFLLTGLEVIPHIGRCQEKLGLGESIQLQVLY